MSLFFRHLNVFCAVRVAQRATQRSAAARCAVERSDEYLCTGWAYRRHTDYSRVSKQAGAFRVHTTFRICLSFVGSDIMRRGQALTNTAMSQCNDDVLANHARVFRLVTSQSKFCSLRKT